MSYLVHRCRECDEVLDDDVKLQAEEDPELCDDCQVSHDYA